MLKKPLKHYFPLNEVATLSGVCTLEFIVMCQENLGQTHTRSLGAEI